MFIAENERSTYKTCSHSWLYHPEITTNHLIYFLCVYVYMYLDYIHAHLHTYAYEHIIIYVSILNHS